MRKLLQQFKKIVFFDTETTGLDPEKDQIIELAAALVTENGITGRKLRQITYMPQSYKLGCRLPDLMNGGGSCE